MVTNTAENDSLQIRLHARQEQMAENQYGVKGGAHTRLADLVQLRHTAKALDAFNSSTSKNPLAGLLTSGFKGRGIDFAEVRLYQPGDDIRTIDWRVTARTGRAHTKLFQEEREKPVLMLVDQSRSMHFGSKRSFKSVLAAESAALIAWSVLDRGDRLGGIVFSDTDHREVKPRRSKHSVLRLLSEINDFNHQLGIKAGSFEEKNAGKGAGKNADPPVKNAANGKNVFCNALKNVRRVAKHGSTLFVISDFQKFDAESQLHLTELSRHNDVVGLFVYDALEQQLPTPDFYNITDGTQRSRIDTSNKASRQIYQTHFDEHLKRIQTEFFKIKAPFFALKTNLNPVIQLSSWPAFQK